MQRIKIISDTHWFHRYIVENGHRPADHNERSIGALRRLVQPDDTVIFLGDLIFSGGTRLREIMHSLPGRKILIRGNHDRSSHSWYVNRGFDACMDGMLLDWGGRRIWFTHEPEPQLREGWINVHGHLHDAAGGDSHRVAGLRDKPWYEPGVRHLLFTLEGHYEPEELSRFIHRGGHYKPEKT